MSVQACGVLSHLYRWSPDEVQQFAEWAYGLQTKMDSGLEQWTISLDAPGMASELDITDGDETSLRESLREP